MRTPRNLYARSRITKTRPHHEIVHCTFSNAFMYIKPVARSNFLPNRGGTWDQRGAVAVLEVE